jgi:hypothetical protein
MSDNENFQSIKNFINPIHHEMTISPETTSLEQRSVSKTQKHFTYLDTKDLISAMSICGDVTALQICSKSHVCKLVLIALR